MRFGQWFNCHRIFKRPAKALIRLRGCTGWSAGLLFTTHQRQVFSCRGPYYGINHSYQNVSNLTNGSRDMVLDIWKYACTENVKIISLSFQFLKEKFFLSTQNKSSLQCYSVLSTIAQVLRKMSLKILAS